MNPYNRFSLFSSSVTAALVLTALAVSGPTIFELLSRFEGNPTMMGAILGGAVTVMVVFWMAFTEVILPSIFRLDWVRKVILGRYYIEGTWLQSEKSAGSAHVAVIDIQPNGKAFTFSGYALDEDLNVNSNVLLELTSFTWPFMTYTYRNSLSDGSDGQRDGVGEVQFEMNRSSARRYNGFSQYIKSESRVRLEGVKLTKNQDVKRLRTLEGREEIVDKYWELFFGRSSRRAEKSRLRETTGLRVAANMIGAEAARDDDRKQEVFETFVEPAPAPFAKEVAKAAAEVRAEPVAEVAPEPELVLTTPVPQEPGLAPLELTETVAAAPADAPVVADRRTGEQERPVELEEGVIPRRRSSDWASESETNNSLTTDQPSQGLQNAEAHLQKAEPDAIPAKSDEPKSVAEDTSQKKQKRVFDARHVM